MRNQESIINTRVLHIRNMLNDLMIDGLIFFNMTNIRYLTGFTGSDGLLFVTPDKCSLLVDGRYGMQATREVTNADVIEYTDKVKIIADVTKKLRLKRTGLEAAAVNLQFYQQLTKTIPPENFKIISDEIKFIRAIKDETEIKLIKKAADIAGKSILSLIGMIKCGVKEKDLAMEFEFNARKTGAEQVAFATIIASGENSALPHAQPAGRKIKKNDFIVMDFGVKYQGYCSDETCTYAFGGLTEKQRNAYQAVKKAHDLAIAAVQSGIKAYVIDGYARNYLQKKKWGEYFVHSTGHGVGLEVHEAPRLAAKSNDLLATNMVLTVEPGVYLPGSWGIRIEDMILVKENSCEIITKLDKELTIIE